MVRFGQAVVKARWPILILSLVLLIPAVIGLLSTRINYDMLTYLPEDMETVKGQDILLKEFGKGAFSLMIVEDMPAKDVSALKKKIEKVDHVEDVLWYDSLADVSIPMEMLPDNVYDIFNRDGSTLMAVFFDSSTSSDDTIRAVGKIREIAGKQCLVSGMSAVVADLKALCEREEPLYVGLAVICAVVVMMALLDNWIIPFLFLASIGMAVLYNLGSNVFFGEISYITKALAAVLQLAVTMDYSIFLWHSYNEQKERCNGDNKTAMARAIGDTLTSVIGSSVTTIAGFIALCFMSYTLGRDLGIVMAKGVLFGVIGCVTILPSMILILDRPLQKTSHKALLPDMRKFASFITKYPAVFLVLFVIILVPAIFGYTHTGTYYDMISGLPKDLDCVIADGKLGEEYDMASTHMILADASLNDRTTRRMLSEIEQVDGVKTAAGLSTLTENIPEEILPDSVVDMLRSKDRQLILVASRYRTATDEVNRQVTEINKIIKKYDRNALLIGEAPCTKDLITVTDHDFGVVNTISIVAIFVIILVVLRSISLPVVLVAVIEFAIFINLGIPHYTHTTLPFIAPICISTIQLGATVDYAILMTSRYKRERAAGNAKREAITTALAAAIPSVTVSALGFFAATVGVAIYSEIDIIRSLCGLMARGAIISMISVIFVLPSLFMLTDKIIVKTGMGFRNKKKMEGSL